MHAIYEITFPGESEKRYVGSAVDVARREMQHRNDLARGAHGNDHLQNAYNKYGFAPVFTVVEEVPRKEDLIEREQEWIDSYEWDMLYNLSPTAGSCLGVKHTAETRKRISLAKKGSKYKPRSAEHIRNNAESRRGAKRSAESRKRMSDAGKARKPPSAATLKKRSESMSGRAKSDETRSNMKEAWVKRRAAKGLPPITPEERAKRDRKNAYERKRRAEKSAAKNENKTTDDA